MICVTADTRLILLLVDEASGSPLAANMERLMTGKLIRKNASHEPATLSDSDIVSSTKSTGATMSSNELRDAELTVVTGGRLKIPGGGFPIGQVYVPGGAKTR